MVPLSLLFWWYRLLFVGLLLRLDVENCLMTKFRCSNPKWLVLVVVARELLRVRRQRMEMDLEEQRELRRMLRLMSLHDDDHDDDGTQQDGVAHVTLNMDSEQQLDDDDGDCCW